MPDAEVTYVAFQPAKYDPDVMQLSIGFKIDGEVSYMNYRITGASEKALNFAGFQIKKAIAASNGGVVPVNVEVNDKGYKDVYIDDGFRSGGGSSGGGF